MRLFFGSVLILTLLFSNSIAWAQEASTTTPEGAVSEPANLDPLGPLQCLDYYKVDSVQLKMKSTLPQSVPGALLYFTGELKNNNPFPLTDGSVTVRIFKVDADVSAQGDGDLLVDEFVVKKDITLATQGILKIDHEWRVPFNAEQGEYYADYFLVANKRYSFMKLATTDEISAQPVSFYITNPETFPVARLSKTKTTINGTNYSFIATPPHFYAGQPVTVESVITNSSDKTKTLPLQWNQYAWDATTDKNLKNSRTEVVIIPAGETKTVSYTTIPQQENSVYVTGITQDNEIKSLVRVRYMQDGEEEPRIQFQGLTAFPLKKGEDQTLFACASAINQVVLSGNTLTLTLKDKAGEVIHEYKYEGDINGALSGFGEKFTPNRNINYATLTATISREGVVIDEITQTYDCTLIDTNSCGEEGVSGSWFDVLKKYLVPILVGLGALIIALFSFFWYRYRSRNIIKVEGIDMTRPTYD